ncbi:sugar transferase [Oceanobacillus chungangensis]|uniref:Sugar transferase n=1 Tax=Oceanobacillus chungangensis TaxID=1229152 RepID=A0A3D8PW99_9BACI|nr:sugar transferase [Oceanobacillus chungangensis]RDW20406.1 sugar transferase [Oceanobacillus chungangensis]
MKRALDVFISLTLIIIFLPIILVISIVVRFALGAPILFKQQRPGLNGQPFFLYKFRTMTNATDSSGKLLSDKQRITAFGMFLRKYSLDELPQLFNVLKGEMSLVGPRPLLMEYIPLYTDEQRLRHNVRPGITGWAQINGRNAITWEEKFKLDIYYVNNYSFTLDMKIILSTVAKVFKSEGINNENHTTMPVFKGEKRYGE